MEKKELAVSRGQKGGNKTGRDEGCKVAILQRHRNCPFGQYQSLTTVSSEAGVLPQSSLLRTYGTTDYTFFLGGIISSQ